MTNDITFKINTIYMKGFIKFLIALFMTLIVIVLTPICFVLLCIGYPIIILVGIVFMIWLIIRD